MTTEIAVLNRLGVALAADSAVTISGGGTTKVFDSADKLFELSCIYPIAIMLNGNMECFGVPWEIIIKDFREAHGNAQKDSIHDWASEFIKYVESRSDIDDNASRQYVKHVAITELKLLKDDVSKLIWISSNGDMRQSANKIPDCMSTIIARRMEILNTVPVAKSLERISVEDIIDEYSDLLKDVVRKSIDPYAISDDLISSICVFIVSVIRAEIKSNYLTGLIFAGYANNDMYPSVVSIEIDGYVKGTLKYTDIINRAEIIRPEFGYAVSFAQTDVIERLLGGVDPRFINKTSEFLNNAFESIVPQLVDSISPRMSAKRKSIEGEKLRELLAIVSDEYLGVTAESFRAEFREEFERMIALMPKLELIELAEALISITAIERKATSDEGTVGGPIDVAFLTKHEGFVWIKRKHYFDPELNPRYFWRKFRGIK
jgi:hypothetical protein